jgi:hydrogenase maturation protein HypF
VIERERLAVSGVVQGVGFRPFVWRLAQRFHLAGEVRNDTRGVQIDVQGERRDLDAFYAALTQQPPPLAHIDAIHREPIAFSSSGSSRLFNSSDSSNSSDSFNTQWRDFRIAPSVADAVAQSRIPVDCAPCDSCITELFTAGGRRWRHPFVCCTDCGPRFTLTRRTPYDRANTSMAAFALCARCAAEYADPVNRRFHAETIACPDCGPTLRFARLDENENVAENVASNAGITLESPASSSSSSLSLSSSERNDAIAQAWAAIARGEIVAVQGLGGFQLICDATNPAAVARLRARKRRAAKPFALLAPNVISAAQWVHADDASHTALLTSPARPIVILPRREGVTLDGIAPGLKQLGVMLPVTPVQYLLFHQAAGQPRGTQWLDEAQPALLVATSANLSGEPLLSDPAEARRTLTGIADAILDHDRAIVERCDDSVVLATAHEARAAGSPLSLSTVMLRRARGYVPEPLPLPAAGPSILALGAQMKSTVTLTHGNCAHVSPYLGDLHSAGVCDVLDATVERLVSRLHITPAAVACDQQPDLYSTRLAQTLAERWHVPLLRVQHHHAHIAAVLAENGHTGPALGLALDGFGYGDDGNAWGGELLRVENGHMQRLGHLTALPLPGGDAAARAPWRMAAALLHTLEPGARRPLPCGDAALKAQLALLYQQIERGFHCPATTSLGRWFDAIAGLAGVCSVQSYEGEAAMKLEALVRDDGFDASGMRDAFNVPLWNVSDTTNGKRIHHAGHAAHVDRIDRVDHVNHVDHVDELNLDLLPLARALAMLRDPTEIASHWHMTLAAALADWIYHAMERTGINVVALGGGCCANLTLLRGLQKAMKIRANANVSAACPTLLFAQRLPPGDDAISYGQAWVLMQQLR